MEWTVDSFVRYLWFKALWIMMYDVSKGLGENKNDIYA